MTLSRTNPRAKGRWLFLGGLTVALMLAVAAVTLAVHDEVFQLDGDVSAVTTTNVGGTTQTIDWDSLFDSAGAEKALPAGFTATGFDRDFNTNTNGTFNTSDNTTFATGSKDTLPITPGWQCNVDNNVLSKNDIMNAYAASYEVAGQEILYFSLERNANTGTANVAFWFLQDENVNCESPGGSTAFTGEHVTGDLLAVAEFTQGGVVNTIQVYRWEGGPNGFLNPDPVAEGVDCATTAGADTACGRVNTATISTPWLTSNKQDGVGHSLRVSEFFEGGINLTAANLGGRCFNVFMADTRSSTSLTATLFDFSRGQLGQCTSTTATTPKDDANANIPAGGLSIGANARVPVHDSALLTVNGATGYDGDVTFFLCGPLALTSTSNCLTGGVQIGQPVAVTGTSPETVTGPTATLTSAGRYCWRAVYSGDADLGVPGSSDPGPANPTATNECFKINPLLPTLTTQASADVLLGNPISDTATIGNTAKQPGTDGLGVGGTINATAGTQAAAGGSITWTAYGPGNCTTVAMAATSRPISGNGTYPTAAQTAVSFTPTVIGVYTFVASYDGNSPNTLSLGDSVCPDPSSAEAVTVTGSAAITTAQDWLPNDTATLTGPTNLNGTLTFQLYTGDNCGVTSGSAVSGQLYTRTVTNAPSGSTFSTSNTTFKVLATASYSWLVRYDDNALADPADKCEKTSLTITN